MFGFNKNTAHALTWKLLTSVDQLTEVDKMSEAGPVLIFKHSTRCGISRMVLRKFEADFQEPQVALYFLDLLAHRVVSNALAERYAVTHQSPQVLVIENGVCTRHDSHYAILEMNWGEN